jgi:hypothetical protein
MLFTAVELEMRFVDECFTTPSGREICLAGLNKDVMLELVEFTANNLCTMAGLEPVFFHADGTCVTNPLPALANQSRTNHANLHERFGTYAQKMPAHAQLTPPSSVLRDTRPITRPFEHTLAGATLADALAPLLATHTAMRAALRARPRGVVNRTFDAVDTRDNNNTPPQPRAPPSTPAGPRPASEGSPRKRCNSLQYGCWLSTEEEKRNTPTEHESAAPQRQLGFNVARAPKSTPRKTTLNVTTPLQQQRTPSVPFVTLGESIHLLK